MTTGLTKQEIDERNAGMKRRLAGSGCAETLDGQHLIDQYDNGTWHCVWCDEDFETMPEAHVSSEPTEAHEGYTDIF